MASYQLCVQFSYYLIAYYFVIWPAQFSHYCRKLLTNDSTRRTYFTMSFHENHLFLATHRNVRSILKKVCILSFHFILTMCYLMKDEFVKYSLAKNILLEKNVLTYIERNFRSQEGINSWRHKIYAMAVASNLISVD